MRMGTVERHARMLSLDGGMKVSEDSTFVLCTDD
jgi:hypothetical protein